ncbi:MAG TPA: DUF2087 domain-containing protein [Kineosporiaceae bacterium]|nr:DUF2087 domain-containing protein [Kineosporiaceae bacterium]
MPGVVPLTDSPLKYETYRRVYAAVLLTSQPTAIADLAGLDLRATMRILQWLNSSGLVEHGGAEWLPRLDRVSLMLDSVAEDDLTQTPIPRRPQQRALFLERAATLFEYGVEYPEAEVNERLKELNPDFAALRRYLVEAQLLTRDHGIYQRPMSPPSP